MTTEGLHPNGSGRILRVFLFPRTQLRNGKEMDAYPGRFLSHSINAATFVVSGGSLCLRSETGKPQLGEREVPLMGVTAAFIFALR